MNRFQKILNYLKEELKFSTSNPLKFEEKWSVQTTRLRMLSFIIMILLVFGILFTYFILKGPFAFYFSKNDTSIERQKLEDQNIQIVKLQQRIDQQQNFIVNMQNVILGKIEPDDSENKKPTNPIDYKSLNTESSENEIALAEKVKDQMRTKKKPELGESNLIFKRPVEGTVSEGFNRKTHPAIDIVAKKESIIKACASGIIVYSGYSQKDGYFVIIDHGSEMMSIYKHNKTNLKDQGQRVQIGDPIAIVGNTGENSSGPHLHFELWKEQKPIDPNSLIEFNQ